MERYKFNWSTDLVVVWNFNRKYFINCNDNTNIFDGVVITNLKN